MTKLTDKLYAAAQGLESGDHIDTSEMIDLLLESANALGNDSMAQETGAPQFTGYELDGNVVGACVSASGDVVINDGDGSVIFNCFEVDILIKALKYLRPMMGEPK